MFQGVNSAAPNIKENTTVQNEIFNIGSGTIHPLKHYVELLFKHLKTRSQY
jgi:hypothetical protein